MIPWLIAFLTTQLIEAPLYAWRLTLNAGRADPCRASTGTFPYGKTWLIALGASAITHPFVWFVFPRIPGLWENYPLYFAVAETFAVVTEGIYLKYFGVKRPFILSLLGNALSAGFGLLTWAVSEKLPCLSILGCIE